MKTGEPGHAVGLGQLDDAAVAELVADQRAALNALQPISGVAAVVGAGVSVSVRLGHLVVEDGLGADRRARRFPRVAPPDRRLSRLVVQAGSGTVTLDALAWCRAVGVAVVGIGTNGELAWSTLPEGPRDARLIRVLALAGADGTDPTGLALVRSLLGAKLAGQRDIASHALHDAGAGRTIEDLLEGLGAAESVDEARQLEAAAAAVYFDAWAGHPAAVPRFVLREASRVPVAWSTYTGRRSQLGAGGANRRATHPTNAVLNYCYTLAHAEATLALVRLGLDPALGVLHADMPRRDSLAWDLTEVARPAVERWVLGLLKARTFRRADFIECPEGEVRLGMGFRQELAATMPRWAAELASHAEAVRNLLALAISPGATETAPLTGARRRAAARTQVGTESSKRYAVASARKAAMRTRRAKQVAPAPGAQLVLWRCPDCGGAVTNARRVRCDTCVDADPAQRPGLRKARARAISTRRQAEAGWSAKHHAGLLVDRRWVTEVLLPAVANVKLRDVMAATGVAKSTASGWRSGTSVPHPMHWEALAALAGVSGPAEHLQSPTGT